MCSGREVQEGGYTGTQWLILVVVWQKPTHHCKAIILQFKKKLLNRKGMV